MLFMPAKLLKTELCAKKNGAKSGKCEIIRIFAVGN